MKKLTTVLIYLFLTVFALPNAVANNDSKCTQIQNQKDYFRISEPTFSSTETIKYEKYIELILKNPRCVSSRDYKNATGFVKSLLGYGCPPKLSSTLLDLYGKKTLLQLCSWAKVTAKRL